MAGRLLLLLLESPVGASSLAATLGPSSSWGGPLSRLTAFMPASTTAQARASDTLMTCVHAQHAAGIGHTLVIEPDAIQTLFIHECVINMAHNANSRSCSQHLHNSLCTRQQQTPVGELSRGGVGNESRCSTLH
jgi:hypothetical protein